MYARLTAFNLFMDLNDELLLLLLALFLSSASAKCVESSLFSGNFKSNFERYTGVIDINFTYDKCCGLWWKNHANMNK